jgi:hypothetical protein
MKEKKLKITELDNVLSFLMDYKLNKQDLDIFQNDLDVLAKDYGYADDMEKEFISYLENKEYPFFGKKEKIIEDIKIYGVSRMSKHFIQKYFDEKYLDFDKIVYSFIRWLIKNGKILIPEKANTMTFKSTVLASYFLEPNTNTAVEKLNKKENSKKTKTKTKGGN